MCRYEIVADLIVANERAVRTYFQFGFEPFGAFLKKEL